MNLLEPDERAAIRAFLQRSEVRLSTVHRVATALLSGAGLMVLLPAIARDSIVSVVRALLTNDLDLTHLCLIGAMVALLALPFAALWLVLRDLTLFYFHAQHVSHDGREAFTPGSRSPRSVCPPTRSTPRHGSRCRSCAPLPSTDRAARAVERRWPARGSTGSSTPTAVSAGTTCRATSGVPAGLFELAASRDRALIEEVAKIEHGMARHILRLQVIVLRYVKALLAFLTTALAVFTAAAVLSEVPRRPVAGAVAGVHHGALVAVDRRRGHGTGALARPAARRRGRPQRGGRGQRPRAHEGRADRGVVGETSPGCWWPWR